MSNFCNPSESRKANKEQEPIAWAVYHNGGKSLHWHEAHCADGDCEVYTPVPLYAPPVTHRPRLTLDEIIDLAVDVNLGRKLKPLGLDTGEVFYTDASYKTGALHDFARAIEARVRGEA